ncbi:Leucine-rich repeat-containing protein 69 [Acipenser ruthenus]|uniref:Leucine-rich repeat-containing protein 69 n=1 Tax=Acipenser ruthenus TaxID=7906 RepID=A0A662YW59_ACIRT|nr:Leucine-rich repeat-containing protein 69 [Acipenser ruthenus]
MSDVLVLRAIQGNAKTLNLNSKKLKRVPKAVGKLTSLSILQLQNNSIATLPCEVESLNNGIHKLRKLRVIDVAGNQLKMFPATTALYTVALYAAIYLLCPNLSLSEISEVVKNNTKEVQHQISHLFNELLLDELYCEDNPFLQKKLVPSIQDEEILSLKEITARYILKELRVRLSEVRVAITRYPEVRIMLSEASMCALCGKGFLNIWLECVKFVNIRKVNI